MTTVTTTVGQLITTLFDQYERTHGDTFLAALATQERLLAARSCGVPTPRLTARPRRTRAPHRRRSSAAAR